MKPRVPEGMRAQFEHHRYAMNEIWKDEYEADGPPLYSPQEIRENNIDVDPRGGMTICYLQTQDTEGNWVTLIEERSYCNPTDAFHRRIGRDIALGRALVSLELMRIGTSG